MSKRLQCVTSFVDIGRGDWSNYQRSTDMYITNFIDFYNNIDLDLIVFCDERIENQIMERVGPDFKTKLNFQRFELSDLNYFKYIDRIGQVQNSDLMRQLSSRDHSNPPEYTRPDYVAMMFAKTEFLKMAVDRGLVDGNNVAWTDFGIGHSQETFVDAVKNKYLSSPESDKVIFFKRQETPLSTDPVYYARISDNVIIVGGFYILPKNLATFFYDEFKMIVDRMLDSSIIDDDQTLLSIFAATHPDKCELINSMGYRNNPVEGDWFPVVHFVKDVFQEVDQ